MAREGAKEAVFEPAKLAQNNRQGRKLMQAYFRQKGVTVELQGGLPNLVLVDVASPDSAAACHPWIAIFAVDANPPHPGRVTGASCRPISSTRLRIRIRAASHCAPIVGFTGP